MSPEARPSSRPKVTVLVTTYNHERYLGEALESVLAQRTEVPYEVLVADDASTDGTARVAASFRNRQPDVVRVLRPKQNLGANAMFLAALAEVRGEYVALLDGDDAWASTDKLARQAAFLDDDPGAAGCFHDATVVYEDGSLPPRRALADLRQPSLTLADVVVRDVVPTLTLMYRHIPAEELRWWVEAVAGQAWDRIVSIDWLMLTLIAQRGPIVRLDGLDAMYRVHHAGVWSSTGRLAQLADERVVYRRIARLLPPEVQGAVTRGLLRCAVETAVEESGIPHDRPVAIAGPELPTPWYLNGRSVVHVSDVDAEAADQLDSLRAAAVTTHHTDAQHFGSLPSLPASDQIAGYLVVTEPRDARPGRPGLWVYADGLTCLSIDQSFALYELPTTQPPRRTVTEVTLVQPLPPGLIGANLEAPAPGTGAARSVHVVGWVVPATGPARRVVVREAHAGRLLATAPVDVERADVAAAFPFMAHAATSGFAAGVVLAEGAGDRRLEVVAELPDGSRVPFATVELAQVTGGTGGGRSEKPQAEDGAL